MTRQVQACQDAEVISRLLRGVRWPAMHDEYVLQQATEQLLLDHKIPHMREPRLSTRDRPDFLLASGVAIECKVAGSSADVVRQVRRYMEHDAVTGVVLLTTRSKHLSAALAVRAKPLDIVFTAGTL